MTHSEIRNPFLFWQNHHPGVGGGEGGGWGWFLHQRLTLHQPTSHLPSSCCVPRHYNPSQSAATATNPEIYKFIRAVGKYRRGSCKYGIKCFDSSTLLFARSLEVFPKKGYENVNPIIQWVRGSKTKKLDDRRDQKNIKLVEILSLDDQPFWQ